MADEVEAGDGERLAEGVARKADGEASVLRPNRSGEPFLAN